MISRRVEELNGFFSDALGGGWGEVKHTWHPVVADKTNTSLAMAAGRDSSMVIALQRFGLNFDFL